MHSGLVKTKKRMTYLFNLLAKYLRTGMANRFLCMATMYPLRVHSQTMLSCNTVKMQTEQKKDLRQFS